LPPSHKGTKKDFKTLSLSVFVAEKGGCLFAKPGKDTMDFATKSQRHKEDFKTLSLRVFVAEKGGG
jgi:hypothetical protein